MPALSLSSSVRYAPHMLIVCSGPDTYHARKKAHELIVAFRAKHDPLGYSTEVLRDEKIEEILKKFGAPSLFAQKRFIQCDGLLADLKIADVRLLAKRLESDQDQTILLTIEEEPLTTKHEKEFEKIKLVRYDHPLLSGSKFAQVVQQRAKELNVSLELASKIATNVEGDMWLAEQELQKCSANPQSPLVSSVQTEETVFQAAEGFIAQDPQWRNRVRNLAEPEALPTIFLSQSRVFARIRDGESSDINPYVLRKFAGFRLPSSRGAYSLLRSIRVLLSSRQGIAQQGEEDILL